MFLKYRNKASAVLLACGFIAVACQTQTRSLLAHRVGKSTESVLVGREARHVLERTSPIRLHSRIDGHCELELAFAVLSGASRTFRAVGTVAGGKQAVLLTQYVGWIQRWNERRIVVPDGGLTGLRLEVDKDAGTAVWARPIVYCPARRHVPPLRNVILVSLDTLRADRLGVYGNDLKLTPSIDAIAGEGTMFEHAYAQFPNTLASHATLFTGYYPSQHGLVTGSFKRIDPGEQTLARFFAAHGYHTVAFTEDAYVGTSFGFDVGFDQYHDGPKTKKAAPFPGTARATFNRAFAWLNNRPPSPFFMFLHTYEVHSPYDPPPGLLQRVHKRANFEYTGEFSARFLPLFELAYNRHRIKLTSSDLKQIQFLYDAEVLEVDTQMDRLRRFLNEHGLTGSTLLVVIGDHGEEFSEHGFLGHGETLYQQALHVPLVFRLPGVVPRGKRVVTPVGLIDVGPTITELAGIGRAFADTPAKSLKDAIVGNRPPTVGRVYSELNATIRACTDWKVGDFKTCPYDAVSVRDGKYAYINSAAVKEEHLFDERQDPTEQTDVIGTLPAVAARYRDAVKQFRAKLAAGSFGAVPAEVDRATREKLKALGYLQ